LGGVALGRQILLRHLGLHLLSLLGDGIADLLADRVGLDDVVAAVYLCEMLAFDAGFGCLWRGGMLVGVLRGGGRGRRTYRVSSAELLLCADDGSASLGGVECGFASDDCLPCCSAPAGLGSNFRDGVPVIHGCGWYCLSVKLGSREGRFRNKGLFVVREEVVCGLWWEGGG
jgi:hypothetical protein